MSTGTAEILSGSADGAALVVSTTSAAGTLVHTATNTAGQVDEVYLFASNSDVVNLVVYVSFGDTANPIIDLVEVREGLVPLLNGLRIKGGKEVRVWAQAANKITLFGWVNRITN
jgi:hypothetical protein